MTRRMQMLKIEARAKINLTLEVLGKRPDGYHEIRSVIQAINLCDSLEFVPNDSIKFKSDMAEWSPEKSLVMKTVKLLQDTTGCTKGASIEIKKRIPLMSGLGGDSSDAAAILHGLNQLWRLGLSKSKLLEMAPQLGSDVSFFLYGGTALMEGRGEKITPLPPIPHRWVILVVPDVPRLSGKTKQAYERLKPSHFTDGNITEKLITDLRSGKGLTSSALFNTFENITFTRGVEISTYKGHILKMGAPTVHLAGTGPALFILLDDKTQAEDLLIRLKNQRLQTYLAETL